MRSRYYASEYHKFSYVHICCYGICYDIVTYSITTDIYIRKLMILTSIVTRSRSPAKTLTNII